MPTSSARCGITRHRAAAVVVLPDAITPADPHPSEHALAARLWIMGVPEPSVNGKGTGVAKAAGLVTAMLSRDI